MAVFVSKQWIFLNRLLPYLQKHAKRLVLGFVCIILTALFVLASPYVMGKAVDSLYEAITQAKLLRYAVDIIGLTILAGIFRFGMRWVIIGVSRDVEFELRGEVFRHLETLPAAFFQENKTGDLMSRATNDLSNVRMLMGPGLMYLANTIVVTLMSAAFMLSISWKLTIFAFLPLPFISTFVRHFGRRIHLLTEESQSRLADLSARVQESMAGVRVVKAFVQEDHEISDFRRMNERLVEKNHELNRATSVFYPMMQCVGGLGMVIVLWFGGREVMRGEITPGDFVAFLFYLGRLTWPMIAFGWVVNLLERGRASIERLNLILDAQPEVADFTTFTVDRPIRGEIEFRNLNFSYGGPPVLRNISLRIPQGRTVAIVGATGSGKTSLIQLIPRLWNAPPDTLFIDGEPIEKIPLATLRKGIGFIPQDTFLFGETIRENIAFGVESASDEEVENAARISNIYEDIQQFPLGFETVVGERGITLSGGQKQRTAISRAVIRDPRILILDDSLSSVDTATEERILRNLQDVMRNRTSILISHRVSTVKDADEIIVLEKGAIVERGTHAELLKNNGYYAELHRRQLLEEELTVGD